MKHTLKTFIVCLLVMLALPSCLKEGNKTIMVNDPQDIPLITDYLPADLLELFGEENVFFGDQPPAIDMEFKSLYQYEAVVTRFNRKISFFIIFYSLLMIEIFPIFAVLIKNKVV